jgi:hypothetical protein
VAAFRARPLDAGPYAYVWVDGLAVKCREAGRIVNVACVVATACNADGHREILGVDVLTTEDGVGWTAFLRDLVARGLAGVELVISTLMPGSRKRSPRCCPGRAGSGAGPISSATCCDGCPRAPTPGCHLGAVDLRPAGPGLDLGPARPCG